MERSRTNGHYGYEKMKRGNGMGVRCGVVREKVVKGM